MYQMGHLILRSGAAKGEDPLERQEGRHVSGIVSLGRSFGLEKRRGATSLVGETRPEVMLIISATSTTRKKEGVRQSW